MPKSNGYGTERQYHPGRQVGRQVFTLGNAGPGMVPYGPVSAKQMGIGSSFRQHPGADLEDRYADLSDLMAAPPGVEPNESTSAQRGY